jgi:hypothetical protein
MARQSVSPKLPEIQKCLFLTITKRHDSSQPLVVRAWIVLLASEGQNNIKAPRKITFSDSTRIEKMVLMKIVSVEI